MIFKTEISTEASTSYYTFDIASDYKYVQMSFKIWILSQVLGNTDPLSPGGYSGFSSIHSNITETYSFAKNTSL